MVEFHEVSSGMIINILCPNWTHYLFIYFFFLKVYFDIDHSVYEELFFVIYFFSTLLKCALSLLMTLCF